MFGPVGDPSYVDPSLDARSVSFENPTGARGAGGREGRGRKGAPSRTLAPGETVVLAELDGPGTLRHIWMTFPPAPPEVMRAMWIEVRYDGAAEPSVSVPCVDFFGVAHGRPVAHTSALTSLQGTVGFNAYFPMPFREHADVRLTNSSGRAMPVYHQIDYTLEPRIPDDRGYLHVAFRRENPTTPARDFVIADHEGAPGRFLGSVVGVRVVDPGMWYGEGEVKVFRDGDRDLPTICGTGLEDYVGSAWGLSAHHSLYGAAPLDVHGADGRSAFVSFYRWHVPDPIMFTDGLRVTIQQIGSDIFLPGQEDELETFRADRTVTPAGWHDGIPGMLAVALSERVDDYCAASFVYSREPRPVPRLDVDAATRDLTRLPTELPLPAEGMI